MTATEFEQQFTRNGLIGKSGRWYPCNTNGHLQCQIDNRDDFPFAIVRTHFGDSNVEFADYYTADKVLPTTEQFETLMDWCAATGNRFEYVTGCWCEPWQKWRNDD